MTTARLLGRSAARRKKEEEGQARIGMGAGMDSETAHRHLERRPGLSNDAWAPHYAQGLPAVDHERVQAELNHAVQFKRNPPETESSDAL